MKPEMNRLCDYILTADEHIRFARAMVIDQMGNILCMKSRKKQLKNSLTQ